MTRVRIFKFKKKSHNIMLISSKHKKTLKYSFKSSKKYVKKVNQPQYIMLLHVNIFFLIINLKIEIKLTLFSRHFG